MKFEIRILFLSMFEDGDTVSSIRTSSNAMDCSGDLQQSIITPRVCNECAHILDNVHGNLRKLSDSTASTSKAKLIHAPSEVLTMHEAGVCEEFCEKCRLQPEI